MAKDLVRKIRRAMDASIPRVRARARITKGIWTDHLSDLKATARRLRKRYQRSVTEGEIAANLREYREAKIGYEQELFATKVSSCERLVGDCLQTDVWGVPYKIVTEKTHPPALLSTLRTREGGMMRDWRESADILMGSLLPADQQEGETPE